MSSSWKIRDGVISGDRTAIVGVINVTPDSFSDGGKYLGPDLAVEHGLRLQSQGAALVDVGGESTRPGSDSVAGSEELRRAIPAVKGLVEAGVRVSIDTSKASVAEAALAAGAVVVNDISALSDPDMVPLVADAGAGVVLMHMQGEPRTMQTNPIYEDVTKEVGEFLWERAEFAIEAGVDPKAICIDPGIGFGKTAEHNLTLLRRLDELAALGYPVMVGTSRKSFLGAILNKPDPEARDIGTGATVALAIAGGAFAVRVHNVAISSDIARVADAIVRQTSPRG
ncbi:MAG: dihydropteroate synthase [Acidimicrobiia bacterium]